MVRMTTTITASIRITGNYNIDENGNRHYHPNKTTTAIIEYNSIDYLYFEL